jgi:hypothetical protein
MAVCSSIRRGQATREDRHPPGETGGCR